MIDAAFIRKVAAEVPSLAEIPLFGQAPPFDWSLFSSQLAQQLEVEGLQVHPKQQRWLSGPDAKKGLGANPLVIPLTFAPLASPVLWVMGKSSIKKLTSWMLRDDGDPLTSEILQEGFYRYLLLQSLDALTASPVLQNLSPEVGEEDSLPEEGGFAIDVDISLKRQTCWGRLILSEAFRKEWVQHFAHLPSEYTPSELSKQLPLILSVKTGSFSLSQEEWDQLTPGDFVLLDKGSYDVRKHQGKALLMLNAIPLFQAKIKHEQLELLDHAVTYEEPMESQESEAVSIKDLPLHVTVEIARLKLTLDQLVHLTPGNTLELPIQPDQAVSLTVNGQKVGRAELIHLGEALGIRILELG